MYGVDKIKSKFNPIKHYLPVNLLTKQKYFFFGVTMNGDKDTQKIATSKKPRWL